MESCASTHVYLCPAFLPPCLLAHSFTQRFSHQCVTTKSYMYMFGGEFTSKDHSKFRHYGDTWRMDLSTYVWEQLMFSGPGAAPSARSGHRMVAYKNVLVLFGGFYDTGKTTRYYNDLWVFDLDKLTWEEKKVAGSGPSPRGGCQLALHQETSTVYVIGGYSTSKTGGKGRSAGSLADSRDTKDRKGREDDEDEKGTVHDDIWALDLLSWSWQKVKKEGMVPTPRTSFGMAVHAPKSKAVMFGGVFDQDGGGDKMYSELFNEAYQFNMNSRRWFPLSVRPPRPKGKDKNKTDDAGSQESHAGAASEDPATARAATLIQAAFRGYAVRKAYETYKVGGKISELLYVDVDSWPPLPVTHPTMRSLSPVAHPPDLPTT